MNYTRGVDTQSSAGPREAKAKDETRYEVEEVCCGGQRVDDVTSDALM
jgi:hypothetical protein